MMRNINWRTSIPYAVLTAISLALLVLFVTWIHQRTGIIVWTILISSGTAAGAITLYLVSRWYLRSRLNAIVDLTKDITDALQSILSKPDDAPTTYRDFRVALTETAALVNRALPFIRTVLNIVLFVGITLELVTLGNAAVLYFQSRKIEEQNRLLKEQTEVQRLLILNESFAAHRAASDLVREARQYERDIFGSLDSFRIVRGNIGMDPCQDEALCNDTSLDEIRNITVTGTPVAGADDLESILGFYRLSVSIAETYFGLITLLPMALPDYREMFSDNVQLTERYEAMLVDAVHACNFGFERMDALLDLWRHIATAGLNARIIQETWDIENISIGTNLSATSAYVAGVVDPLLKIGEALDGETGWRRETVGPQDAGIIFVRGIDDLEIRLKDLSHACEGEKDRLSRMDRAIRDAAGLTLEDLATE